MKVTLRNQYGDDKDIYRKMQKSPIYFIKVVWKLTPQPIKKEFKNHVKKLIKNEEYGEIRQHYFEKFNNGKHITWQQWIILLCVEKCVNKGYGSRKRVSVASGHGIGKTCVMSWILLWFLFCHIDAQASCTANTAPQIYDVLWKEASKWINKMPSGIKEKYEWQNSYIRIHDYENSERVWFARARTSSKENPEALAGMHGDHQLVLCDEASGVPDAIFSTMEGALTDKRPLVVMISNPTRNLGYFYDSHHKDIKNWYALSFNSKESPIVSHEYVQKILDKNGEDSDEYRIRVLGQFPSEDAIDDKGYVPLFVREDFKQADDDRFVGTVRMGVDPAGEGSNKSAWVLRDDFKAKVIGYSSSTSIKKIAQNTLIFMDRYNVDPKNVTIDNFGIGANVAQHIALSGAKVNAVNVGDKPKDKERYQNLKAELFFALKEWIRNGGEIYGSFSDWEKEFLSIKYTRSLGEAKIKIKPKKEMMKEGIPSPDRMDALMLSFYGQKRYNYRIIFEKKQIVSNVSYKRKYF